MSALWYKRTNRGGRRRYAKVLQNSTADGAAGPQRVVNNVLPLRTCGVLRRWTVPIFVVLFSIAKALRLLADCSFQFRQIHDPSVQRGNTVHVEVEPLDVIVEVQHGRVRIGRRS